MADWKNEKASAVARIAFALFRDADLTRDEQRQVLAIMGSELAVESPAHLFLEQVWSANHCVTAPYPETEDREREDVAGPVWRGGDSSSWAREPTP